jgi:hypothetical protein
MENKTLTFQEKLNRLQKEALEQITLKEIIERSKKEYYDNLKVSEDDIYSISILDKNGAVKGMRKFSSDDIVKDIKEFAKKTIRRNSDVSIYTKKDGKELKDVNSKISDVINEKNENIVVHILEENNDKQK